MAGWLVTLLTVRSRSNTSPFPSLVFLFNAHRNLSGQLQRLSPRTTAVEYPGYNAFESSEGQATIARPYREHATPFSLAEYPKFSMPDTIDPILNPLDPVCYRWRLQSC